MANPNSDLWDIADKMRARGKFVDLFSILQGAVTQGVEFDLSHVRDLTVRFGARSGLFVIPKFVTDFIILYLKKTPPQSILDIWGGIGATIIPIVREFQPGVALAFSRSVDEQQIAQLLWQDQTVELRLGDPLVLVDDVHEQFDVVVGSPPWNLGSRDSIKLPSDHGLVEVKGFQDELLILKGAKLLRENGTGFFVTCNRFMIERANSVYASLAKFGLFVDAALTLPSGTFAPHTNMPGLLLIIRRQKQKHLFVGELTPDQSSRQALLRNLKQRKSAKVIQLGALLEQEQFQLLPHLVLEREIRQQAKKLGLSPTSVVEVATAINLADRQTEDGFLDIPNSVYLPTIGRSPAVDSLTKLRIKPQNYIQLVLDPDKAFAPYVANFLNTSLGQKIRQHATSGVTIPKISKMQLSTALVYLPSLADQTEIVRINNTITELSSQLEVLHRQLWNDHPRKASKVEKILTSLKPDEGFERLIDPLPFPLASILWTFHATADVAHKESHLLHFFEALSQFTVTLMLSALSADKMFYTEQSGKWTNVDEPEYQDWFIKASFGSWNLMGRRMAKAIRTLRSDREQRERCFDLFGDPETEFLDMLTDKNLFAVLDRVKVNRDSWKGHGGIESEQEARKRLTVLEASLNEIIQLLLEGYANTLLLSPRTIVLRGGIFKHKAQALMGTRTPFREVSVETRIPMDEQKLYLLHSGKYKPVEIVPLFRIEHSPEIAQNACYFYNRLEGENARWVSYHFEGEPEFYSPGDDVEATLSLLRPQDSEANRPKAS